MRSWPARAAASVLVLGGGCAPLPAAVVVIDIPAQAPTAPEAAPAAPAAQPAPTLLGHWEGEGVQESGPTWTMVVDVVALGPGVCGRARYPKEPCTADWICSKRSDGRTLQAREHLTSGQEACVDDGEMTMEVTPAGTLAWRWTGSGEAAHAELTRTPARR